jgi:hypothetical protein
MRREFVENMRFISLSDPIPEGEDKNDLKRDLCSCFDRMYKEVDTLQSPAFSDSFGFAIWMR